VYSFFISYYLYILLNQVKTITLSLIFSIILGFLALLTTGSSVGYFVITLFLLNYLFKILGIGSRLIIFLSVIILFFIVLKSDFEFDRYIEVLSLSSKARLYDLLIIIETIKNNFYFGYGYASEVLIRGEGLSTINNDTYILNLIGLDYMHESGITNGLLLILGFFGVPFGLFVIYHYFKVFYIKKEYVLIFILLVCLSTQPIFFTPFVFLIYLLRQKKIVQIS
jgi:hypothetical protein